MVTAKMIRMPPIVGVPFFRLMRARSILADRSGRSGVPCSLRMSQGPTTKQITRAVIARIDRPEGDVPKDIKK